MEDHFHKTNIYTNTFFMNFTPEIVNYSQVTFLNYDIFFSEPPRLYGVNQSVNDNAADNSGTGREGRRREAEVLLSSRWIAQGETGEAGGMAACQSPVPGAECRVEKCPSSAPPWRAPAHTEPPLSQYPLLLLG